MDDHKRKKKRGRTKIFRSCFPSFDEKLLSYDKSDHRNTRYKRSRKPVMMAVSDRKGKDSGHNVGFVNESDGGGDYYYKRCCHRRIISRLLKSVWFDALMVKKIHRKLKIGSDKIKPLLSMENTVNSTNNTGSSSCPSNILWSSSRTICTCSNSSSFSSSSNSNCQQSSHNNTSSTTDPVDFRHHILTNPQSHRHEKDLHQLVSLDSSNTVWKLDTCKIKSVGNNSNIRMCLFLILSLVVMIGYGRIYSILFTSAWFYFLPRPRVKRVNSVLTANESPETDPYQYKKRVIMAGLLDRARNPLR